MKELLAYLKNITELQESINILNWELRICAPEQSKKHINELISKLERKLFVLETSEDYKTILFNLVSSSEFKELSEEEQKYIHNLCISYFNKSAIPEELAIEKGIVARESTEAWLKAKENNDFEMFKPYLERIIDITKKYYEKFGESSSAYDCMLNMYERGMSMEVIDPLFEELKNAIVPIIGSSKRTKSKLRMKASDQELQQCALFLLDYIGFDTSRGIVAIFPHGYTEKMNQDDIRIAMRRTDNPITFVKTIIHEGGHGIFEQNIDRKLCIFSNNLIDNLYALHESQSRFFENFLCKNINFWIPIFDKVKEMLHLDCTLEEFMEGLNEINVCPIRTEADELSYNLHIIIRYEIEREIFNNNIDIDEIPRLWNEKYQEYMGILPTSDYSGILQDIHWSEGHFGYFPSYTIGNIYDGIIYDIVKSNLGDIDDILRNGRVKDITDFLSENIYRYGGAYTYEEVFKNLGYQKSLSAKPLINYYNLKYKK